MNLNLFFTTCRKFAGICKKFQIKFICRRRLSFVVFTAVSSRLRVVYVRGDEMNLIFRPHGGSNNFILRCRRITFFSRFI